MATLYKKVSTQEVKNRNISQSSETDKTSANMILNTFVTLFKNKHLS
jgi:RNase H-fold protein (predicted Holliday junction resolvase)